MNILVTTPMKEHNHAKAEGEFIKNNPDAFWFRTLRNPKISIGERVYYVDMGMIVGYGIVFDIVVGGLVDTIENRNKLWTGTQLKQREWVSLKTLIPYKGFQGFRYIKEDLQKVLDEAEQDDKP